MEAACTGESSGHHGSHGRLARLGGLVLITMNVPNNIQVNDGARVFKLGTYLALRAKCRQLTTAYRGCMGRLAASQTCLCPPLRLSNHTVFLPGPRAQQVLSLLWLRCISFLLPVKVSPWLFAWLRPCHTSGFLSSKRASLNTLLN